MVNAEKGHGIVEKPRNLQAHQVDEDALGVQEVHESTGEKPAVPGGVFPKAGKIQAHQPGRKVDRYYRQGRLHVVGCARAPHGEKGAGKSQQAGKEAGEDNDCFIRERHACRTVRIRSDGCPGHLFCGQSLHLPGRLDASRKEGRAHGPDGHKPEGALHLLGGLQREGMKPLCQHRCVIIKLRIGDEAPGQKEVVNKHKARCINNKPHPAGRNPAGKEAEGIRVFCRIKKKAADKEKQGYMKQIYKCTAEIPGVSQDDGDDADAADHVPVKGAGGAI